MVKYRLRMIRNIELSVGVIFTYGTPLNIVLKKKYTCILKNPGIHYNPYMDEILLVMGPVYHSKGWATKFSLRFIFLTTSFFFNEPRCQFRNANIHWWIVSHVMILVIMVHENKKWEGVMDGQRQSGWKDGNVYMNE